MTDKIGFEFEFLIPDGISGKEGIRKIFLEELGVKLKTPYNSSYEKGHWVLTTDDSVSPLPSEYSSYVDRGYEVCTPPMYRDTALEVLQSVFELFKRNEFKTNNTCGIHINVDIGPLTKYIDPVALVVLSNETDELIDWNRLGNYYCLSLERALRARVQQINKKILSKKRIDLFSELYSTSLVNKFTNRKFVTMNFSNENYLEYRALGGKNYEYRYKEIEKSINRLFEKMEEAALMDSNPTIKSRFRKRLVEHYGLLPLNLPYNFNPDVFEDKYSIYRL